MRGILCEKAHLCKCLQVSLATHVKMHEEECTRRLLGLLQSVVSCQEILLSLLQSDDSFQEIFLGLLQSDVSCQEILFCLLQSDVF